MKYDDVSKYSYGVPTLSTAIVSEIESLSEIKELSFVIAVGVDSDGNSDRLVVLVPDHKGDGVSSAELPIETKQLLDSFSITATKFEGCHWFLNPPGKFVRC